MVFHSLRSGGASLAAAIGMPDRQIMHHGDGSRNPQRIDISKRQKVLFWSCPKLFSFKSQIFILFSVLGVSKVAFK